MTFEKHRRGTAIVTTPKGILVVSSDGKLFSLPGGQARRGENDRDTVLRELREETGLVATSCSFLFEHTSKYYYHKVHLITVSGDATPHQEIKYIAYFTGANVPLLHSSRRIIERYQNTLYKNETENRFNQEDYNITLREERSVEKNNIPIFITNNSNKKYQTKKRKSYFKIAIAIILVASVVYFITNQSNLMNFSSFIQTQTTTINSASGSLWKITNNTISPIITSTGISVTGRYKNYQLGIVKAPDGVLSDSYGNFVVLINNINAKNPTYSQLLNFLKSDKTDQYPYQYVSTTLGSYYGSAESNVDIESIKEIIDGTKQQNTPRICVDFAEMLYNNAEKSGIRCAFISIQLSGYTDPYNYGIPSNTGHCLDAFNTTDRGLVYIDDTGISGGGPSNCDKIVSLKIGNSYIPQSLFPEYGWDSTWSNSGIVTSIYITWGGNWNN
jgi:hypothetical protein